ncbi:MAG: ferritin-like domain-containing protein [Chryseobacterium sp.]|nr:MAG: ferritin-like domain-containing protein [Chryseobacterium sp.]
MQKPTDNNSDAAKATEDKKTTGASTTSSTDKDKKDNSTDESKKTAAAEKGGTGDKSTESKSGSSAKSTSSAKTSGKAQSKEQEDEGEEKPLKKFFVDALKDIYYAEHALVEALPKMKKAATTEELQDAFEDHELQTRKQISRLEKVFRSIDEKAEKKDCKAMDGIIKEAEEIIKSTPEGSMTRDAALIIAAQKAEHYEIASYGGLVQLAITLGYDRAADLLDHTLEEEEETDYLLTDIAESFINFEAEEEGEEVEDDDYDDEDYDDEEDYDEYDEEDEL